jgi:hypothetical protein
MKTQLSGKLNMKCIGFLGFCLTWPFGWPRDQIAQRLPNVKNDKNVNENTAFCRFEIENVKNVNENTAFWQVDYEFHWFSLVFLHLGCPVEGSTL